MKKNNLWATVAGLAMIGAGVGAALVYLKKNQPKDSDFEDENELEDEECETCEATERTYTVLSDTAEKVDDAVEEVAETVEETVEDAVEEIAEAVEEAVEETDEKAE